MDKEQLFEENKCLRKELLKKNQIIYDIMEENKKLKEYYWKNRAKQDEGC